jgi:electron transfer flavoprotein alpha subunit
VVAADEEGRLSGSAFAAVKAARLLEAKPNLLLLTPSPAALQRAAATLSQLGIERIDAIVHEQFAAGDPVRAAVLGDLWPKFTTPPRLITGERWTELALARLARTGRFFPRIKQVSVVGEHLELTWAVQGGKLQARQKAAGTAEAPLWLALTDDAEVEAASAPTVLAVVHRWSPTLERVFGSTDLVRLIQEVQSAAGVARLSEAEFILDVGAGVGNRDGYEAVVEPLEKALRHLGVRGLHIGGSRKVTEELHILPVDCQIGQSGVSVNPKILIAIGISGAPQHLQYIGPRATIISFNKDAEAPLMTLNQRQARPVVFPVVGDLFVTVPAFTAALLADRQTAETTGSAQPEWAAAGRG